jgi:hypothetical protein
MMAFAEQRYGGCSGVCRRPGHPSSGPHPLWEYPALTVQRHRVRQPWRHPVAATEVHNLDPERTSDRF